MFKITTNNHERELLSLLELPTTVRDEYDYITEDDACTPRFVAYRGDWYDVHDMQVITVAPAHTPFGYNVTQDDPLAAWHGIATDSHWSGVVVRYTDDYEHVVIGRAWSE
jgi:hypothetical protein